MPAGASVVVRKLGAIDCWVRIALAQINPTVGDFSGNLQKIAEFVERAAARVLRW
jgi:hypothetical protein